MKRDKTEFELHINVSSIGEDKVKYLVDIDKLVPEKGSLIIVDEIDIFMLDGPCKLKAIVTANTCLGLTATPANTPMKKKIAD